MSRHLRPAESPISEDDAFLEEVLKRANLPALLMSLLHITGDRSILAGPIRPGQAAFGAESPGFSDEGIVMPAVGHQQMKIFFLGKADQFAGMFQPSTQAE